MPMDRPLVMGFSNSMVWALAAGNSLLSRSVKESSGAPSAHIAKIPFGFKCCFISLRPVSV